MNRYIGIILNGSEQKAKVYVSCEWKTSYDDEEKVWRIKENYLVQVSDVKDKYFAAAITQGTQVR